MIKLTKGNEPQVLKTNKAQWTGELMIAVLESKRSGDKIPNSIYSRYNTPDVKLALKLECKNKCMYCESFVAHVAYEHIEHYKPKAKDKFPQLTFEYSNLGIACQICNMNKGDTFDTKLPFINPYTDDPELHFMPYGAMVFAKPNNHRAKLTELEIELNRPELMERRRERMKTIRELVEKYNALLDDNILKGALKKEIELETSEIKEYSFITKALASALMV